MSLDLSYVKGLHIKPLHSVAAIAIAGVLTACDSESNTVVSTTTPPVPTASTASSTSADTTTSSTAPASAASASGTTADAAVLSTDVDYTKSMERLQQSADRLRDSIQTMAQHPAGPQRNDAIKQAREALTHVNQAMLQLPPDMRVEAVGTTGSAGAGGAIGSMGSQPDNAQSLEVLQKAAQKLRGAIQAMAQQAAGERRNQAIKEVHQALYDTNQAMIQLPPDMSTQK